MLMAEQEPYALMVQPDDMLISPREVNDNFGTMVCFHPRYALGDHHNYIDKDDFLREMYLNTVGNNERGTERYERMVNMVWSRKMTGDHPDPRAVDDAMLRVISEKYVVMPLYLLDHSGLAMQTESFHDPWDSGQVGWVYVSKEDVLKEFGGEKMTGALRKKAEDLANGVPMKMIQEWLGHSDFSTTANIYSHLDYASKVYFNTLILTIYTLLFDFSSCLEPSFCCVAVLSVWLVM